MEQVQAAQSNMNLRPHQEAFYRGHRSTGYKLLPSLYRQRLREGERIDKLERRMFFEFRTRARQLYDSPTDWDILFHMQHHGVPTRLLDWTSVFGVALYFALLNYDDNSDQPPCIWILNPYALNAAVWNLYRLFHPRYLARDEHLNRSYDFGELLLGTRPQQWKDGKLWETPMAIYSHQRSERMFAQNGWFTIHGEDRRPIDEIFWDRRDIVSKVEVPRASVRAAREFLSLAGIGHRQLFPDLDGIARSLCEKFLSTRPVRRS
jgi:hypothetical protein